jgi:hypothetical protein
VVRRLFPPDSDIVRSINDQLAHFAAIQTGMPVQPLTRDQISAFFETAFWASLQSSEGRPTHVYLIFATPDGFPNAVAFALPVEYNETQIVRLSPAVPSDGCLVVTGAAEEMNIWAIGRDRRGPLSNTFAVDIVEPGTIRVDVGPFRPYAVLNRNSTSIIESAGTTLAHFLQRVLQKFFPVGDFFGTQATHFRLAAAKECMVLHHRQHQGSPADRQARERRLVMAHSLLLPAGEGLRRRVWYFQAPWPPDHAHWSPRRSLNS